MIRLSVLLLAIVSQALLSQARYPFNANPTADDITAYWYNVPDDSLVLKVMGRALPFRSTLEVYAPVLSDSVRVSLSATFAKGQQPYTKELFVKKGFSDPAYTAQWRGKFFKVIIPVSHRSEPPSVINITILAGTRRMSKTIDCRYHTLSGTITDFEGKPLRAAILVRPDDFDGSAGMWSDAEGNYRFVLPERIYSNIFVDNETYGLTTAEAWAWHIIMDEDQTLDFKVGTAEVYNLNVWANNGGARTYFLSFRPMSVVYYQRKPAPDSVVIEDQTFRVLDVSPRLRSSEITVKFNGKVAPVVSLQKYFERTSGNMMPAFLVQVNREGLENIGKQTVTVEYRNESEIDGKNVAHTSMGVFQFYTNFTGLSFF